jgi:hypothetical protein
MPLGAIDWPAPKRQSDPAARAAAVTPSNTAQLGNTTRRLFVGTGGLVYVDLVGNSDRNGVNATATGTYTVASASGTITATIGGTAVTATGTGNNTTDAATLAANINANNTVNKLVSATSALGVITLTAVIEGKFGNAVTTTATGTGLTAGQATLTGGTGGAGNYLAYKAATGTYLNVQATRVYALGTTATDLVAEW